MKANFILILSSIFIAFNISYSIDYEWEMIESQNSAQSSYNCKNGKHIVSFPKFNRVKNPLIPFPPTYSFGITDYTLSNWSKTTVNNPLNLYFFDVGLTGKDKIFVSADSGYVLTNIIGSPDWETRKIIDSSVALTSISFRDENFGICASNLAELYSTTDGGDTWHKMTNQVDDFADIFLVEKSGFFGKAVYLLIYDHTSKLYYIKISYDSGVTWQKASPIDETTFDVNSIYFDGESRWWLAGGKRTGVGDLLYSIIVNSMDGGKTWQRQLYYDAGPGYEGLHGSIHSIAFYDNSSIGLAIKSAHAYFTSDYGSTWTKLTDDTITKGPMYKLNNEMYIMHINKAYKFILKDVSVNDNSESDFSIYPNPAGDFINLSVDSELNLLARDAQILNLLGIVVSKTELRDGNNRIDISNLARGTYFIKVGDRVERFVKM